MDVLKRVIPMRVIEVPERSLKTTDRKFLRFRCRTPQCYPGSRGSINLPLITWAKQRNIQLNFIHPGKSQQNVYIERYNRAVHYDWLRQSFFHYLMNCSNMPQNGNGSIIMNDRIGY